MVYKTVKWLEKFMGETAKKVIEITKATIDFIKPK